MLKIIYHMPPMYQELPVVLHINILNPFTYIKHQVYRDNKTEAHKG